MISCISLNICACVIFSFRSLNPRTSILQDQPEAVRLLALLYLVVSIAPFQINPPLFLTQALLQFHLILDPPPPPLDLQPIQDLPPQQAVRLHHGPQLLQECVHRHQAHLLTDQDHPQILDLQLLHLGLKYRQT